jgi:hypothetical protein
MHTRPIAILLALMTFSSIAAAAPPTSLLDLLARVPPVPSSAAAAGAMLKDDEVADEHYLRAKADLQADMDWDMAQSLQATGATTAAAGIDLQRLQTDPAYAAAMQQRMASMTPAEAMAMSGQMQNSQMQDAQKIATEPPAVRAAYEAYQNLMMNTAGPAGSLNHYSVIEPRQMSDIEARFDARQAELSAKLSDCNECDDAGVRKSRENNKAVWKQKLAVADEELREWDAFFTKARTARQSLLQPGDAHMKATDFGRNAKSSIMRTNIQSYHAMLLGRVNEMLEIFREATRHAGGVAVAAQMSGEL